MPVTIQLTGLKYKNSQGQFQSADCLKGEDADISIIAPDYSELTFPVNAGKLCTHDLKLYRAKQGIPTSENWTESHWDERTIEEELAAKYTKPAGGIPASDLADGVIPDIIDDEAGAGDTDVTFSADKLTSEFDALSNALNQKQEKPETTGQAGQVLGLALVNGQLVPVWITPASGSGDVTDVQIDGTSILDAQGVANLPIANNTFGVVKIHGSGLYIHSTSKELKLAFANATEIKTGNAGSEAPIGPGRLHESVFYGLAKAAGADMKNVTGETVGVYPETQKSAISQMLNGAVQVTGTTPVITAKSGIRYICGECATLDITAPESGCVDITFTSGSTPTVLTVTSAKANTTIKWVGDFDPDALEANTQYEINVMDGEWGMAVSWT